MDNFLMKAIDLSCFFEVCKNSFKQVYDHFGEHLEKGHYLKAILIEKKYNSDLNIQISNFWAKYIFS
jgi:hypothetical protein